MPSSAAGGQQHYAGTGGAQQRVLGFSSSSLWQRQKHEAAQLDLQIQSVAAAIDVPTLPEQVRQKLRALRLPVRLFGENLANVRDRLRLELARRRVLLGEDEAAAAEEGRKLKLDEEEEEEEEEQVTKYTQASPELVQARQDMAAFSLRRARLRLEQERQLRKAAVVLQQQQRKRRLVDDADAADTTATANVDDSKKSNSTSSSDDAVVLQQLQSIDRDCRRACRTARQWTLEGSQYGDARSLSCIATCNVPGGGGGAATTGATPLVATGSWTGTLQLWDGSSPALSSLGQRTLCHEDRIMGLAMIPNSNSNNNNNSNSGDGEALICTTSIDLTAKLWKVKQNDDNNALEEMEQEDNNHEGDNAANQKQSPGSWSITEQAHFKGHAARLCRTAFHPMHRHVATTSFDHTWRLWDLERSEECLLLQDGHAREVYGVGFHPDGSLVATTDFAGVVQVWDLRTGKSIRHFLGHAGRVLNAEFHPVAGFQMATAGDDGTIKIWDLRKRRIATTVPAHSGLVTALKFEPQRGEIVASSSFDGTVKVWNARNWTMLHSLPGHEGKVSGVDIVTPTPMSANGNNIKNSNVKPALVSCGFDKTLKMWR